MFAFTRSAAQQGARFRTLAVTSSSASNSILGHHRAALRQFHATSLAAKLTPYLLADIGEGITECEIIQWFVKPGDRIAQFDRICEVQSDKASVEITSRFDGVVTKLHHDVNAMAKVGYPLVDIDVVDEGGDSSSADLEAAAPAPTPAAGSTPSTANASAPSAASGGAGATGHAVNEHVLAAPSVRRIAKENNVDLSTVIGTGKDGRITKEDIQRFVETGGRSSAAASPAPTPASSSSVYPPESVTPASIASAAKAAKASAPSHATIEFKGVDEVRNLSQIQKAMFKAMAASLQIPHFGFSEEIEVSHLRECREEINRALAHDTAFANSTVKKITYMPLLVKALSVALEDFPILNARVLGGENVAATGDVSGVQLQYRASHNIGIAMDTPAGLIVPNVKGVQKMTVLEVAAEIQRLQEAGRSGTLQPQDLKDGTITLSNIGIVGGTYLSPVIVRSEVCIGAIGKIQRLPRFEMRRNPVTGHNEEVVVPKEILRASWSADHRVIDGATLARFVRTWKELIEKPFGLIARMR
ncbi:hypothetical protein GQ42DRAFT_160819 [Ramicandelaber brevisporus]|nr:hypothetical protein GQ42DRAFT_160819 [Ramicandelaber brevisporus]